MIYKHFVTTITILLTFSLTVAQKKILTTEFTTEKIIIDGKFDETSWKNARVATNFFMIAPDNGKQVALEKDTEVRILYDNNAIYVAAFMKDNEPTKIAKELTLRDNFATAEHFGIYLNGYNDGQQEFRFFVSSSGVQQDVLYTESFGSDFSFNAIWESKALITNEGWFVEMKIPYAALRFTSEEKQTWGLNFYRELQRDRQQYTWNLIDNKIPSESNQAGILEGIQNIKTPTRLFLIPYSSLYINANENQKTKVEFKGGLDVKYGINDAFTLDAILVPDFGQTAFDNVELNLGPFEQQFSENRPFFTEGTELFNKGNLVYSRRIGGSPSTFANLSSDEIFTDNPVRVNLLNALKVSGRTKSGLGIGILNAVTDKTEASIKNTITGEGRNEVIEPLANYNVFVLDQRFRKNSSVSFINTNVTRNNQFRDANVSAVLFDLNTKKNTYNLSGDYKYSYINEFGNQADRKGYNTSLNFSETSGKYRFGGGGQYVSTNWDNNDLGINFQTHYHSFYTNASYRILNPTKIFNSFSIFFNNYNQFNNRNGKVQESNVNLNVNITTKKNDYHGFGIYSRITDVFDFYSPFSQNNLKSIIVPKNYGMYYYFSSNYNRKFALDFNPSVTFIDEDKRVDLSLSVNPRYRFSDKFSLVYNFRLSRQVNDVGYIDFDETTDNTIFARRNRNTFTNTISGKYTLNDVMNINLSVRHYWSYAVNNQFLNLQDDGTVANNAIYNENQNSSLNTWNLDLSYSWWFAPGSQISVLYRNNSFASFRNLDNNFNQNITDSFKNSINYENLDHIFSVSIRYFIDYNSLKR